MQAIRRRRFEPLCDLSGITENKPKTVKNDQSMRREIGYFEATRTKIRISAMQMLSFRPRVTFFGL